MRFDFTGHLANGTEVDGQVEAATIEEAAGLVRTKHKVYARKITPAKAAPTALIREQAPAAPQTPVGLPPAPVAQQPVVIAPTVVATTQGSTKADQSVQAWIAQAGATPAPQGVQGTSGPSCCPAGAAGVPGVTGTMDKEWASGGEQKQERELSAWKSDLSIELVAISAVMAFAQEESKMIPAQHAVVAANAARLSGELLKDAMTRAYIRAADEIRMTPKK